MKKAVSARNYCYIFLLAISIVSIMLCVSCKKDEDEDVPTSYTFVNKVVPLDGLGINAWIYEYDTADVRIDSNYIEAPAYKKEYTFYPNPACHHIKARVFTSEKNRWSPHVFLIRENRNVFVEVTLTTPYIFTEPEYTPENLVK